MFKTGYYWDVFPDLGGSWQQDAGSIRFETNANRPDYMMMNPCQGWAKTQS